MLKPRQIDPRFLSWEATLNTRDLGGIPLPDGQTTRLTTLVRSDNLYRLTPIGCQSLLDYGVRTIIDLRLLHQLDALPNPFAASSDDRIVYHHISLIDPCTPRSDPSDPAENMIDLLDNHSDRIAMALSTIANAADGAVLFHCMGGQDRTGLISALLLDLAGAEPDAIANDYALTATHYHTATADYLANGPGRRVDRAESLERHFPHRMFMDRTLAHLHATFGNAESYLLRADVTPAELEALKRRLVEAPSSGRI